MNRQTAYEHNAHSSCIKQSGKDHGWADAINNMINQRYAFLGMEYGSGYLYRGVSSGLANGLLTNQFWHTQSNETEGSFEQDLNVLFVSQDLSDALSIARIWENKLDAGILIFNSTVFNQALMNKKGAMMATAEPGVVFKYPFITFPLKLDLVDCFVLRSDFLELTSQLNEMDDAHLHNIEQVITELKQNNKVIYIESNLEKPDRKNAEIIIRQELKQRNLISAKEINSDIKPVRRG